MPPPAASAATTRPPPSRLPLGCSPMQASTTHPCFRRQSTWASSSRRPTASSAASPASASPRSRGAQPCRDMRGVPAEPRHLSHRPLLLPRALLRSYTVYSSAQDYDMAYFSVVGNGEVDELGPNDGDPLPGGRQPDASCVVRVSALPLSQGAAARAGPPMPAPRRQCPLCLCCHPPLLCAAA